MKQAHLADLLRVSQGTISKWETGAAEPSNRQKIQISDLFSSPLKPIDDSWVRRLIENSFRQVHAMCDVRHNLLAASPSRVREWARDYSDVASSPLSCSLPSDILNAERWLQEQDSPEVRLSPVVVTTSGRKGGPFDIEPGLLLWERLPLADGQWIRFVTNIQVSEVPRDAIRLTPSND